MTKSTVKVVISTENFNKKKKLFSSTLMGVKPIITHIADYTIIHFEDIVWNDFEEDIDFFIKEIRNFPYHLLRVGESFNDLEEKYETTGKLGETDESICSILEIRASIEYCN